MLLKRNCLGISQFDELFLSVRQEGKQETTKVDPLVKTTATHTPQKNMKVNLFPRVSIYLYHSKSVE